MTTEQMHPSDENMNEDPTPADPGQCDPAGSPGIEADAVEDPPMAPEQEAAMLRIALAEAREEVDRQIDAVQRGKADLTNARRRHDEERLSIQQQANSRLLVQLLPIVDELDLAVNHLDANGQATPQEAVSESWVEGVRLIQRKLAVFLESQGVGRIESLGEPFNPELHEAVGMAQVEDSESGHIVEVLRQGYRLHDRVIQVAQVVVNQ